MHDMAEIDPETTCRMQRDELLGLIELTSAAGQRITSEIPTVTLHDLLQPEPGAAVTAPEPPTAEPSTAEPPPPVPETPPPVRPGVEYRLSVIAVSFAVSLVAGIATGLMLLS